MWTRLDFVLLQLNSHTHTVNGSGYRGDTLVPRSALVGAMLHFSVPKLNLIPYVPLHLDSLTAWVCELKLFTLLYLWARLHFALLQYDTHLQLQVTHRGFIVVEHQ